MNREDASVDGNAGAAGGEPPLPELPRRTFLRWAGQSVGAAALAPSLPSLLACAERRIVRRPSPGAGYGPLREAGPELELPDGFAYEVLTVEGRPMSDGRPTPRAPDGMAAFPSPSGTVLLVRNHEDQDPPGIARPLVDRSLAWDPAGGGGTTTLEVRVPPEGAPELVRDFVSLGGTILNCAGGATPWGSWLTCEETTQGRSRGWGVPHGYVFEVAAGTDGPARSVPLRDMGRFVHEAVAVDPDGGYVYETEDVNRRAGFYRFRPRVPGRLAEGGVLEMLAVRGEPRADLRRGQTPGAWRPVEWIEIPDPDPADAEREFSAVFLQGFAEGGARFSRLEGCWYADDSVYFHATNGGDEQLGQVWRYVPAEEALALVFESPSVDVLNGPDNLTMSPGGGLLICEDNSGATHLRGLTAEGEIFPFARNILNHREFAGACFSPDGRVLFVNIQGDLNSWGPGNLGYTLAIWGPWQDGPL